jgi:hypothetical protein
MAKALVRNGNGLRSAQGSKYDANNTVLSKTYGALADLRRELSDSKAAVAEREELLRTFSSCVDSQRSWLLLEDYFERLSLSRKDFPATDWWPRVLSAQGRSRLEEVAFLFLRAKRSLPTELTSYANLDRFAEVEQAAQEQSVVRHLEAWLFPPRPAHLDAAKASLRVLLRPEVNPDCAGCYRMAAEFQVARPRTGERPRRLGEIRELMTRAAHEQEMFTPRDWEFIDWISKSDHPDEARAETMYLTELELLHWLARWGSSDRLEFGDEKGAALSFTGQVAELTPHLQNGSGDLAFTHRLTIPGGKSFGLEEIKFFSMQPPLVLAGETFYLLRNAPPAGLLQHWTVQTIVPVRKLSHRLLVHLRKAHPKNGVDWEQLCITHAARPEFVFELQDETVRLKLVARSQSDQTVWIWTGHEWQPREARKRANEKPEILDDPRLEPATSWLRQLDWFTPEPGLWVADANEGFLGTLAGAWPERPHEAEYLGNPAFHRLFLAPRQLRPRLIVKGSGIDWLSVSAEWEQEGMQLTSADLQRLQAATGRFVKLPGRRLGGA